MNKVLILPIIAALVCALPFSIQDAHAITTYTAQNSVSHKWSDPLSWVGGVVPFTVLSGDTVVIPVGVTIKNTGSIANNGQININGELDNSGSISNNAGGVINISSTGIVKNSGNINNFGMINNNGGTFTNNFNLNNFGTINNVGGHIINTFHINNPGSIHNASGGTITNSHIVNNPNTSGITNELPCGSTVINTGSIAPNPPVNVECTHPSIPEFPFAFSLVVMFVAVAAVYMGIRQKMSLNFKKF